MSIFKRRLLTAFFILLFLVLAPIIIFYANGTIMGEGWNILATGGISIRSMESGSQFIINGKTKEIISFFTRDYFLKNLRPGDYTVEVKKEGYNDWKNKITVYPNKVVESKVFMLPVEVISTEIKQFIALGESASSSVPVKPKINPEYEMVNSLFATSSVIKKPVSSLSATTSTTTYSTLGSKDNPIENRRLALWADNGAVFLAWNGNIDSAPKIFCEYVKQDIKCTDSLAVYDFASKIKSIDFFPGESEVLIASVGDSVYAIEAENNPDKKPQLLYRGHKPDFRVFNSIIYIKDTDFLGRLEI